MTTLTRLFRPICRWLPPVLAYRLYYRLIVAVEGTAEPFHDAQAWVGKAVISSTMADVVDAHFAYHGCSEFLGVSLCRLLVAPGQTVFEIGANLGTETLNLAAIVGSDGLIVALEPARKVARVLTERARDNRLTQVRVVQEAVSDVVGHVSLSAGETNNSGMAFVAPLADPSAETVMTTTIDELARVHGPPQLIWMDIEGLELRALRGALQVLRTVRPYIYTEVDRGHLARAGDSLRAFFELVADLDYVAIDPRGWRLEPVDVVLDSQEYYHVNWLLIPRERSAVLNKIRLRYALARVLPRW
jgi:FkbM family methyltransferase